MRMQLSLPKGLGEMLAQFGSFCQMPSITKRYSYLPGFRFMLIFHCPFESLVSWCESEHHPLKSPANFTLRASGASSVSLTLFCFTSFRVVFLGVFFGINVAPPYGNRCQPFVSSLQFRLFTYTTSNTIANFV